MTDTDGTQEPRVLLNPALDRKALAARFAKFGRVQISDLLNDDLAADMFEVLQKHVPWSVVFNEGSRNIELTPQQLKFIPQQEQIQQMRGITLRAQSEFQFLFNSFMILNSYKKNEYPEHPLYFLLEYINGEEFLGFVREVTGIPELAKADAQATFYQPGHFLTRHEDAGKQEEGWRLAYVMSFTKDWKADWGGLLHFFDDDSDAISETFVPRFNSLSLFRVPVPHSVSMVTPFAGTGRYAVTGWIRDR